MMMHWVAVAAQLVAATEAAATATDLDVSIDTASVSVVGAQHDSFTSKIEMFCLVELVRKLSTKSKPQLPLQWHHGANLGRWAEIAVVNSQRKFESCAITCMVPPCKLGVGGPAQIFFFFWVSFDHGVQLYFRSQRYGSPQGFVRDLTKTHQTVFLRVLPESTAS
jgi:hypothetical protein